MSSIMRRLWMLITRSRYDRELKEEIAFHVEARERELIAQGIAADEAHFRAQREFGNPLRIQERSRRNVMFWWEWIVQDLQFAIRLIRKAPAFTTVIVISMAIGIGATTSIFSVLNAMVLRELSVRAPGEMYLFSWSVAKRDGADDLMSSIDGSYVQRDGRYRSWSVSFPLYESLRQRQTQFEDLFAFAANSQEINIGIEGHSYPGLYVGISGNYFNVSGVTAFRGRILDAGDDTKTSTPVAMISHRFWTQMGADPNIVGKTATVNGQLLTIVGVTPPGFTGYDPSVKTDIFVPLQHYIRDLDRLQGPFIAPDGKQFASFAQTDLAWWLTVGGRLKPNANATTAAAELNSLFRQHLSGVMPARPATAEVPLIETEPAGRGLDSVRSQYQTACLLLLGLVGVVLLIACANVSALLLSRATARQREIAQRLSMGASRGRIIWQLLTESLFLSLLGALAGFALAYWTSSGLAALISSTRDAGQFEIHMDGRVLLFTAAVTFLSGLIFGLVPAVQVSRTDPMSALKQVTGTTRTERGHWPGKLLVAGQLALALLLMVSAVLFTRTLRQFGKTELGFDQRNLIIFNVRPGLNGYTGAKLETYYNELRRRVGSIPGVQSVTMAQRGPVGQGAHITTVTLPGAQGTSGQSQAHSSTFGPWSDKETPVHAHLVGDNYFNTLHVPVIAGRAITQSDTATAPKVVVVNKTFVSRFLKNQNPIGMIIRSNKTDYTIVGVSGDVKYARLRDDVPPTMYVPYQQRRELPQWMAFMVRVQGDARNASRAIERAAAEIDAGVPVADLMTEQGVIDRTLFVERTFTLLSSSFAGIAMVLACVGLYGTLSYMVARRTNEIGVRMALGAQRSNILEMVMRDGWKMALLGVAMGVPLTLAAAKLIESRVYGISPRDPLSLALGAALVLSIALIVGLLPAWRASRVDPMVALKYE